MNDSYLDLFIRGSLGDNNDLPRTGDDTQSPDIIPWGTKQTDAPTAQYAADHYDEDIGKPVSFGQANHIYVRAKNDGDTLGMGAVSLYAAYKTDLSSPAAWQRLETAAGNNSTSIAANPAGIGLTDDPFVWNPDLPSGTNPYLLIAVVATKAHPDPVANYRKNPQDFAAWQANQGGVAARAIAVPAPPKRKATYAFSALVNLGNSAEVTAQFDLSWTQGVVGDLVSLVVDKPGIQESIGFEGFRISAASQSTVVKALVPAGFSCTVQYEYQAGDARKLPAPSLTLTVSTVPKDAGDGGGGGGGGNPFSPPDAGGKTPTQVASYQFATQLAAP